jgi:hypothetical protein
LAQQNELWSPHTKRKDPCGAPHIRLAETHHSSCYLDNGKILRESLDDQLTSSRLLIYNSVRWHDELAPRVALIVNLGRGLERILVKLAPDDRESVGNLYTGCIVCPLPGWCNSLCLSRSTASPQVETGGALNIVN